MDISDFLINAAVSTLLLSVKNNHKKDVLRAAFAKVYRSIATAYSSDPEFQRLIGNV